MEYYDKAMEYADDMESLLELFGCNDNITKYTEKSDDEEK